MRPSDLGGAFVFEGLAAPAWLVALATSAFLGAKFVLTVRQNGNGNGRGRFEGQVVTLLETQRDTLNELRNIAASTQGILEKQNALLAAHDQRAAEAIRRMDARP